MRLLTISFNPLNAPLINEQDMACVDDALFNLALLLELHHGLHLRSCIVTSAEIDLCFLHQFEEANLHSSSADIASDDVRWGCNFIHFVKVNNTVLCQLNIVVCLCY